MAAPETRKIRMPFGIPGDQLGEVERNVPVDEPPALPTNESLGVIGSRVARQDGRAKVTGAARYSFDVQLPGMIHGRISSIPCPHARILSIDLSAARKRRLRRFAAC